MILPTALNNATVVAVDEEGFNAADRACLKQAAVTVEANELRLREVWTRLGLNPDDPFTDTTNRFSSQSGSIQVEVTGDCETTTTQTRVTP